MDKRALFDFVKQLGRRVRLVLVPAFNLISRHDSRVISNTNDTIGRSGVSTHYGWLARVLASLVLAFASVTAAYAGAYNCGDMYTPADYPSGKFDVIDGFNLPAGYILSDFQSGLTSMSFDGNCTIKNFPTSIGGFGSSTSVLNFNTLTGVIVFDNVDYKGKLTCNQNKDGIVVWWANGSVNNTGCEYLFPYVDGVLKNTRPANQTTQKIGVPFIYRLTMAEMFKVDPLSPTGYTDLGYPDPNVLTDLNIYDDLTTTGADLTYVTNTAYIKSGPTITPIGTLPNLGDSKHLHFQYTPVKPNEQLLIDITVVLDDTAANVPGTLFTNTATWTFDKNVTANNGTTYVANDLPGHDGSSQTMTIAGHPNLLLDKTGPTDTTGNLNLGQWGTYVLDITNNGVTDAWTPTIVDNLPSGPTGGMCNMPPVIDTIGIYPDGVSTTPTITLVAGTDYTYTYTGPTGVPACQMQINLLRASSKLAPLVAGVGPHLKVTYRAKLDANSIVNNALLTNVAATSTWYNGNPYTGNNPKQFPTTTDPAYPCLPTDGTPAAIDCQDFHATKVVLKGVIFEKTVENLATGANPASTASPGTTLRYTLKMQSIDDKSYSGIAFYDDMGALNPVGPLNPAGAFVSGSLGNVTIIGSTGTDNSNPTGGTNGAGILNVTGLTIPGGTATTPGQPVIVSFDITLAPGLGDTYVVSNQARASQGATLIHVSDDPNLNGLADPGLPNDGDPTNITIRMPQPPTKAIVPPITQATIGEVVTYEITVPGAGYLVEPLTNVVVTDVLSPALEFVSASIGATPLTNTGTPTTVTLPIGDISVGQVVVVTLKARVVNLTGVGADAADTTKSFSNAASFSYTGGVTPPSLATAAIAIVEPKLTATKSAANVTVPGAPANTGNTLEYQVTLTNSGGSTAFDTNVTDTLPANLSLVAGSSTVSINGAPPVAVTPSVTGNVITWGRQAGDGSFDIPATQSLVLTYRVTVNTANGAPITNSVTADYTSLDTALSVERTGNGCPAVTAPNDYCTTTSVTYPTVDPTMVTKSVFSDTYAESPITTPPSVRVGDTIVYRLTMKLREGALDNFTITDVLPAGLAFDGVVSVNGDTTAPYSASAPFSYTDIPASSLPTVGATGTLTWNMGNFSNTVDYNTSNDTFTVDYRVKVIDTAGLAHAASTLRVNTVTLSYTGATSAMLSSFATVDIRQPVISTITKTAIVNGPAVLGSGTSASPYQINVANNTMSFTVQACNTGLAPAYGVVINDQLPNELNQTTLTTPILSIGATGLVAGTDYTYTPPAARGGQMSFALSQNAPLNPGACLSIQYGMGFYTDIAPNLTWANSASVAKYWSLTTSSVREYVALTPVTPAQIWMTNIFTPVAPSKTLVTPVSGEATIGDTVTYEITVPATPVNAALNNVSIIDTLDARLTYVSWVPVSGPTVSGPPVTSTAPLTFTVGQIPAGQTVKLRVTARVANTAAANAGGVIPNVVSYTYTGQAIALTSTTVNLNIVEPTVAITKSVAIPATPTAPNAGDELTYTVNLTASSGANFSNAYDLVLTDTLDAGLQYVAGSSTIGGVAVPDPAIAGQTLTWPARDLLEGASVQVIYKVKLSDTAEAGQVFCNKASTTWTSLSGASANERTGSGGVDDYLATVAPVCVTVSDNTTLAKAYASDTYSDGTSSVRIGDYVEYTLTLGLQEGTTKNVVLTDTLPTGMAYDGLVSITPSSGSANYTYTLLSQPAQGNTGLLTWNFGSVTNAGDNNTANDLLIVRFRARVLNGVGSLSQLPTTQPLLNNAALNYSIFTGPAIPKTASDTLNVLQPNIASITKTGTVLLSGAPTAVAGDGTTPATAYQINVVNNTMRFNLQACNSGAAPAYGVVITDKLAAELNEASITTPVVTIGATTLTAGTDYTYVAPAAGGTMSFTLKTPLAPSACANVTYTIGFRTDIAPDQTWNNSAIASQYWSLPQPDTNAKQYGPTAASAVYMTNKFIPVAPSKTVVTPATGEVTIGETVTYEITVPATPVNAALSNVVISDPLNAALEYLSATQTSGPTVTNTSSAPTNVGFTVAKIPAGQQVVIQVKARVVNSGSTNAGGVIPNVVSYTYTGQATALTSTAVNLTIVEPLVAITKSVAIPATPAAPNAGDDLTYTVNLSASSGATYSTAYDLVLTDTLDSGLSYVAGSTIINGVAAGDPAIAGQVLTWPARNIAEGATVTVVYKARLSDSVSAGQTLCNKASSQWTSLSGAIAGERTGSASPAYNDYAAAAVPACVLVNDNTTFAKAYISDTYSDGSNNTRIGDLVTYTLTLGLQEGTTNGVVATDVLPTGLAYEGLVSIAPATGSNFTYTLAAQPTAGATGTLTWNFGSVKNAGDNNAANDFLVITYRARVLNNSVLSQTPTTQTLTNNASLAHTIGGTPAPTLTSSQSIGVLQPLLAITKSAVTSGGDTVIDAYEVVTYTVSITNSGTAPAYDTIISDTIPLGMRVGGVTTTTIRLVNAGITLPLLSSPNFSYNSTTGVATWNLDTGVADAYTIPVGETLEIEYRVTADATLGAGWTLTNSAQISHYYSFDNNAVPTNGQAAYRQDYVPATPPASVTLTSTLPGDLSKANQAKLSVAIGETFSYTIKVPAVPVNIALYDVQIIDTLPAGMDLVSVSKNSAWGTWSPSGTVSGTTLTIKDNTNGIDIPAGAQAEVTVTLMVRNDTVVNFSGRNFTNTATYNYNQMNTTGPQLTTGLVTTTPAMTIVGPDNLTLTKAGPASMIVGTPGTFTLTINNPSTGTAWDMTVIDLLPNPTPGGMCTLAPNLVSAVVTDAAGTRTLSAGSDFTLNFATGTPTCTYTFVGTSAAAALGAGGNLVITYTAELDPDNGNGIPLTNIAGVTQWYSQDTSGAGSTGQTHTYTGPLTDGTPLNLLDNQSAWTLLTASPTLNVTKEVFDKATGNPASTAEPGDTLHYKITVVNTSNVPLPNFSIVDDLGILNNSVVFSTGTLSNITVTGSTADLTYSSTTGGKNGAGLIDVRNLSLGISGSLNNTIIVEFDVTLMPVIDNGTVVLNQAQVVNYGYTLDRSDDPLLPGVIDPTQTIIGSSPLMQVIKTVSDITGDPAILMAGETARYTIKVKNIGNENGINTLLTDAIPANTTYVPNTTRLNGVAVADPAAGVSALEGGMLINAPAPEITTPGFMRADATATTANVATITFDVMVNPGTLDGTFISNQGYVIGTGNSGTAYPIAPSDDPATPALVDPTLITVSKPNGIVYNAISREPVAGVTLVLLNGATGQPVPSSCFTNPAQQGQVTSTSGYYKFDLNFSSTIGCPAGGDYLIQVATVPKDVMAGLSVLIPPTSSAASAAYSVPACTNDADLATTHCEAQLSATAPQVSATDTRYYLHLTLNDGVVPDDSQIFNNHIPLDPKLDEVLPITKRTSMVNVTRGQLVPYTITVESKLNGTLTNMSIIDMLPLGFKYVKSSARYTIEGSPTVNSIAREPVVNGNVLSWNNLTIGPKEKHTIKLLAVVSSGVAEGEYVNNAQAYSQLNPANATRRVTATVRVVPDPTFDCSDVIGKVFDDDNRNGIQDKGEKGLPGVRVVTARGLLVTTDKYGRFHISCAAVPNADRGSNFILKVDDRTLPSGYRITTENPLVQRATRGKMLKFNFGATIHKVVRLDIANGVFEPGSTEVRIQWKSRLQLLMNELKKGPSILRLAYMAEVERESLVDERLEAMKAQIAAMWAEQNPGYELVIETELFWRTGAPPGKGSRE